MRLRLPGVVLAFTAFYIICSASPVVPLPEEPHPSPEFLIITARAEQCASAKLMEKGKILDPDMPAEGRRFSGDCDGNSGGC